MMATTIHEMMSQAVAELPAASKTVPRTKTQATKAKMFRQLVATLLAVSLKRSRLSTSLPSSFLGSFSPLAGTPRVIVLPLRAPALAVTSSRP
jgi:hypothetical protein